MNKYVIEKRDYIETLNKALQPLVDFGSVQYLSVYSTGAEYLKLNDSMGGAKFMDVTSCDLETILLEVIELIVAGKSAHVITDKSDKRKIASLFKGGAE